jgi:hypothetical protein
MQMCKTDRTKEKLEAKTQYGHLLTIEQRKYSMLKVKHALEALLVVVLILGNVLGFMYENNLDHVPVSVSAVTLNINL